MNLITNPSTSANTKTQNYDFSPRSSEVERIRRERFIELFRNSPIRDSELIYSQLLLYLSRQELGRLLALSDLYREHVLKIAGSMMEFGTCYGRTAALLTNLRGALEPYNFTRKLIVFDTFSGLKGTTAEKDGTDERAADGAYSSCDGYERYLDEVLHYHESEAPIPHIKKFTLIKGDASETVRRYLKDHPETILSFVYFDFDIYKPTKDVLQAILPHLVKGAVVAFDELNCREYPGETVALYETMPLGKCALRRSPLTPWMSHFLFEGA